jgi:hypothetical protein
MEHSVPERQIRVDKSDRTAETISFDGGKSISTWEVHPGQFLPFQRSFGERLLQEEDNTVMSRDGMVTFMADHLCGNYDAVEKAPGIFTLRSSRSPLPMKRCWSIRTTRETWACLTSDTTAA